MQIVGYHTAPANDDESDGDEPDGDEPDGDEPDPDNTAALLLASEGAVERVPLLPGEDLAYRLGERHCAGTVDDGSHRPCAAPETPYCPDHRDRWACARCTGNCDLPLPTCHEEHAVYLAAFRPATYKVGVTRSWRLDTRLREQGADRAAHLRTVVDGRVARQIETDIAAEVGDRVRVPAKIRGLHEPFDVTAWEALLADYDLLATFAFEYGIDLRDRPMQETIATGAIRGTKGRVLLLDNGGSTYAVDLRDLVGFEVEPGDSDRDLQASLGAWD